MTRMFEMLKQLILAVVGVCLSVTALDAFAVDVESLTLIRAPSSEFSTKVAYDASISAEQGDALLLSTVDGREFSLHVKSARLLSSGNRAVRASTRSGGEALLVVAQSGSVVGFITDLGVRYQVSQDGFGKSTVVNSSLGIAPLQIDRSLTAPPRQKPADEIAEPLEFSEEARNSSLSNSRIAKSEKATGVTFPQFDAGRAVISVLFYYDSDFSDPAPVIDYIVELTNESLVNSGAQVTVEIAGRKAISIPNDIDHETVLDSMYDSIDGFESIDSDREAYAADLVIALREPGWPDVADICGIASYSVFNGLPYRNKTNGVVQYKQPSYSGDYYCTDFTFAHEFGHLLGAAHHRADYEDLTSPNGAYSYSYGFITNSDQRTIMGNKGSNPISRYSSPPLFGRSSTSPNSADNTSTFAITSHMVGAYNGNGFSHHLVRAQKIEGTDYECESDGLSGYWDATALRNDSSYDLEVASVHYVRPDGSESVSSYDRGERYINSNRTGWRGWCVTDDNPSRLRTTYSGSYHRFYHPITDEIVQLETLNWDADYDGEYKTIRVATTDGGQVQGHPTQSVEEDSRQTVSFTVESGYAIVSIESTCPGERNGTSFTLDVGQDDCFVEAIFQEVEDQGELRLSLETPVQRQTYTGIATIQGWAIADEGIDRVDVYIDDSFFQSAPYGGEREDVGGAFPGVDGSSYSGFALTYNYSLLSRGEHKIRAEAITSDGRTISRTKTFSVDNFHKPFIGPNDEVSFNNASCSIRDSEISIFDAYIDGRAYDLMLEWRTANQNFQIFDIR